MIHITGPSDVGQLGAFVAHRLRLPLVAGWHTNLHEYAARRLERRLAWFPEACSHRLATLAQHGSLRAALRFYRLAELYRSHRISSSWASSNAKQASARS